jgi:hypothetical protein
MFKLQEKPSALEREHPALQNMTFLNIFLFSYVIFALLDSDSDSESDLIEYGSGSSLTTLKTNQILLYKIYHKV